MKDVNIKCLKKLDISENKLPLHIGEEGITIDGVFYKNRKRRKVASCSILISDGVSSGRESVRKPHQRAVEAAGVKRRHIGHLRAGLPVRQKYGEAASLSGNGFHSDAAAVPLCNGAA